MTVNIYVARDSEGREWSPDYEHEVAAITEMTKKLWTAYHHLKSVYCVVANLRQPSADMVIISERGLGVVELKHNFGKVTLSQGGSWYAGSIPVKGGSHGSPYNQLQSYAGNLHSKLLPVMLPAWLKRTPERWNEIKIQMALCFSHPHADLNEVKKQVINNPILVRKPWQGSFEVITPSDITLWALKLRFGINQGEGKDYEPLRLEPSTIENGIKLVLRATEWTEILSSMPTSQSYGYLVWQSQEGEQKYNLDKDEVVIGRSSECDWVIPDTYKQISKRHCKISRGLQGVRIEDLGSTNGTYLNNKQLKKPVSLVSGQEVSLSGRLPDQKGFRFKFVMRGEDDIDTSQSSSTEHV